MPRKQRKLVAADTRDSNPAPSGSGGSDANRGFFVQSLMALMEVAKAKPPFETITIEPRVGHEKFDFVWTRSGQAHAVQIKTTKGKFTDTDIRNWAADMEEVRKAEICTLMLVGRFSARAETLPDKIGGVTLDRKLHDFRKATIDDLEDLASQRLGQFFENAVLPPAHASERLRTVKELGFDMLRAAISSETLTHIQFIERCKRLFRLKPATERTRQCAYPRVVDELNKCLRRDRKLAALISEWGGNVIVGKGSDIRLADTVGMEQIDLVPILDLAVPAIGEMEPSRSMAQALSLFFGGLIILTVDPAWIVQERERAEVGAINYPGERFEKYEGDTEFVNYLNVVLRAKADACCSFDELFVESDRPDDMRFPGLPNLGRSVLKSDKSIELMDEMARFQLRFIAQIQKRRPGDPAEIQKLFTEVREQIARAPKAKKRPYFATDPSYGKHLDLIKGSLALAGLVVVFPSDGSESDIIAKSHLMISQLHELRRNLTRLSGGTTV